MRYVLLLRGINVGGKNKVSMKDLKMSIGELGYQNVVTYINSGNVIFDTDDNIETVKIKIAEMLKNVFFPIQHVIITREEYLEEVSNLPEWWNETLARKDVLFMPNHINKSVIIDFINKSELYNEIVYVGRHAVFWGKYTESEYLKTTYHKKLMKQDFYKHITIRNGKTFEKIAEILEKED